MESLALKLSWSGKMMEAVMMILPRPDVTVTPATDPNAPAGSVDLVISREGKGRSYRIVGDTTPAIVKDAVEKVLGDPYNAEFLPSKSERP